MNQIDSKTNDRIISQNNHINYFPPDWTWNYLGELGVFSKGKGILKEQLAEKGIPCIRYGEIYTTNDFSISKLRSFIDVEVAKESKEIKNGDILFAGSGETIEEIGKAVAYIGNEKAYAGGDIIIFSVNDTVCPVYLSYALETDFSRKQKRKFGQGQQVVHIYTSDLRNLILPLPPYHEQLVIAQLLSTTDNAIEKHVQIISQKELRKKWLMQQLLTGKKRLKGFEDTNWLFIRFIEIYAQKKEKAGTRKFIVLSVTRDGIVSQAEYFNKEIASEDTSPYLVMKKGDMVISGLNFWMGSIDVLSQYEIGMVSPAYKVFEIINKAISSEFMKFFIRSEEMLKALIGASVIGASIVRRNLDRETLDEWTFKLPAIEEQTAIAAVLQAADKEIQLLKAKSLKLKEQKKWLMQQLLTGKKRIQHEPN